MSTRYNLVVVLGPTASGKTSFAAQLAYRINGEVISADSRQVYRQMNLGTGKDYSDYCIGDYKVTAHLIDIADPGYKYNIFEYQRDFTRVYNDIISRGRFPVLCGGSGMYIDAATREYPLNEVPHNETLRETLGSKSLDELRNILSTMKILHNKTDTDTVEHAIRAIEIEYYNRASPGNHLEMPDLKTLFIGIRYEREIERARITERLEKRLHQGMVEEVSELLKAGIPADTLIYYGLEYRYITMFLQEKLDFQTMKSKLNTAIHQFAKRQRTWFRKMEREGCCIHWLDGNMSDSEKIETTLHLMNL
jgi:tRNA dimethylallyltransferase